MNENNIVIETINRILFPRNPICSVCNRILIHKDDIYCSKCDEKLEWIHSRRCDICGRAMDSNGYSNICENCEKDENYFSKGYSLWSYDKYSKRIIKKIKYGGYERLAINLGKVLYENTFNLDFLNEIDIVIPTPSDKIRFIKRGYNQAYLIAKGFCDKRDLPLREDIVLKEIATKDQIGLSEKERKANLKGAFSVKNSNDIKDKTILIVDDVLTTSATINEISKVLLEHNANKIYFLTITSKKNIN